MKKVCEENTIRYKIINGKKKALCDYNGNCENLAFKEVYSILGKRKEDSGKRRFWLELFMQKTF